MCNKRIKHSTRNWGITHTSICNKPDYKDGLCKKHYDNLQYKLTNWGDRSTYRSATEQDMLSGRSMKLKNTNQHKLFVFRNKIQEYNSKLNKYVDSNIQPDYNLFCVKI